MRENYPHAQILSRTLSPFFFANDFLLRKNKRRERVRPNMPSRPILQPGRPICVRPNSTPLTLAAGESIARSPSSPLVPLCAAATHSHRQGEPCSIPSSLDAPSQGEQRRALVSFPSRCQRGAEPRSSRPTSRVTPPPCASTSSPIGRSSSRPASPPVPHHPLAPTNGPRDNASASR